MSFVCGSWVKFNIIDSYNNKGAAIAMMLINIAITDKNLSKNKSFLADSNSLLYRFI